jgi:hypothetical protein
MPIVAVKVEMPPKGELETKGGGESPTDEQMEEESRIRQEYIDSITPAIEAFHQVVAAPLRKCDRRRATRHRRVV